MKTLYRPADTASDGPSLMKACRHQSKDCEVCKNQLLKNSTINLETGKSQTKNKILQKYSFPEVIHEGLSCSGCKVNPIKVRGGTEPRFSVSSRAEPEPSHEPTLLTRFSKNFSTF